MFALHSLELFNFRSYRGLHNFKFPTIKGLYYLTGENLAEPDLGANGTGKSTLLDAIMWVLYGRTARGLKANEVITWGSNESCHCALELTVGKQRSTIKRSQKPNSLTLDGSPVDQTGLEKFIRLNFDSFLRSVINAQFSQSFLALLPSAKLVLFSDIMGLDYWLKKSDEAVSETSTLEASVKKLTNTVTRNEMQIELLQDDIIKLEESRDSFETERDLRIKEISKVMSGHKKQIIQIEKLLDLHEDDLLKAKRSAKTINEELEDLVADRDAVLDVIRTSSRKLEILKSKQSDLITQKEIIPTLKGKCPVCVQQVDAAHISRILKLIQLAINDQSGDIGFVEKEIKKQVENLVRAKVRVEAKMATVNDWADEISKIQKKIDEQGRQWEDCNQKSSRLNIEFAKIKKDTNPYVVLLDQKKAQVKTTKALVKVDAGKLDELEAQHVATKFWIKGFKRIRLFIIEQAFRSLEIEVNNSLAQLGMTNWQITFDVERENKAGGFTKGFNVFVKSPANKDPVRWENWSGGETQRLQLAADLGLANLIMQQNGLTNTIEIFDEPSTHLSAEGMVDLANMLHDRAISEGKRIWIVDHASITNFGEFEGVITTRKDKHGSTITTDINKDEQPSSS